MIFPTDAACDDSLKERLQNVPENRAGSSPVDVSYASHTAVRTCRYTEAQSLTAQRDLHDPDSSRLPRYAGLLGPIPAHGKSSLNGRECLVLSNKLTSHSAPRRLELSAKKRAAADRVWRFLSAAARNLFFKQSELRLNRILYLGIEQVGVQL